MASDVCSLSDEAVRYLSARGPRTDAEVALFDSHIRRSCAEIQMSWSDKEKKTRAIRAGATFPPVEITFVDDTSMFARKVKREIND